MPHSKVIIIDYGSQVTQLIARRRARGRGTGERTGRCSEEKSQNKEKRAELNHVDTSQDERLKYSLSYILHEYQNKGESEMPIVLVNIKEGRSVEQKRAW